MFKTVMTLCYLGINCYTDLKRRQVYGPFGIGFGLIGIFVNVCTEVDWKQVFLGIISTLVFAIIAWITKESMGYGDVLCIFACSMWVKPAGMIMLLIIGFLLSALVSMVLLIIRRKSRHDRIPFVPFLLLGYISMLMFMK